MGQSALGGVMLTKWGGVQSRTGSSVAVTFSVALGAGVGGGVGGALTVMSRSHCFTLSPLVTLSTTWKFPIDVYVWLGWRLRLVPPSPNCQA